MLTEQGEKFFEERVKLKENLQKKLELLAPPFFSGFWFSHPEKLQQIREPIRRFVKSLFNLTMAVEENPTELSLKEVRGFLNSIAEKIEELNKKLKERG